MNTQNAIQMWCRFVMVLVVLIGLSSQSHRNVAFGEGLSEEQIHALCEEIRTNIRLAQDLRNDGKYDEALRVLYDTMYNTHRAQLLISLYSDEKLPTTASQEIGKLEEFLIREDPSPLLQRFRDPNVSLQEKQEMISELRDLAEKTIRNPEGVCFRGQYHGTLVQLMISRKISVEEKWSLLFWVENTIRREYTSQAQQEQLKEEMLSLLALAKQKLSEQRYVEAFVLLEKATQRWQDIWHTGGSDTLSEQSVQIREEYIASDMTPLMRFFRDPTVPIADKKRALSELKDLIRNPPADSGTVRILGKYDGTLVQIITHPEVDGTTKFSLLGRIERMNR